MYKHSQYFLAFFSFENTIYIKNGFVKISVVKNKPLKIKFKRSHLLFLLFLNFFDRNLGVLT